MRALNRILSLEREGKIDNTLRQLEREARDNRRISYILGRHAEARAWGELAQAFWKARKDLSRERKDRENAIA
jgi:hypothetical protein